MVWPGGLGMIWHGTCYGLAGITWYMEWPGGHRKVYDIAWQGMWKGIVLCALTSRDVEKTAAASDGQRAYSAHKSQTVNLRGMVVGGTLSMIDGLVA